MTVFYNRRLTPAGVTARQFALLRQISLHPGCSVRELADIHQIGAFLSAWPGGILLELTGGYTVIWCLDLLVCTFASLMNF